MAWEWSLKVSSGIGSEGIIGYWLSHPVLFKGLILEED